MPHLVILYTANLDAETDMPALCRALADAMLACATKPAPGLPDRRHARAGLPGAHWAVADGGAPAGPPAAAATTVLCT
jgi:5-carboxymethyl-2-hydroxymuconate isomerase